MTRYIVLEVAEDTPYDSLDLIEALRTDSADGRARLSTADHSLVVRIPKRFDANPIGEIDGADLDIYVAQEA